MLPQLLDQAVTLDPLFIHTKDRGVAVYYEEKKTPDQLVTYFAQHPDMFIVVTKEYHNICRDIRERLPEFSPNTIASLFQIIVEKIYPVVPIVVNLGQATEGIDLKVAESARKLRVETETILYESGIRLYDLIVQKIPTHKDFADYLLLEEILSGELPTEAMLLQRKENFVYVNETLYGGMKTADLRERMNIDVTTQLPSTHGTITGQTVYQGAVRGTAKLVFSSKDAEELSPGDILISPMTTPNLVTVMKKAAAIVTDEGGVTSHAAIAARELKIPCIVGTRFATEVIKNGDLVEVNADKGFVRLV